MAQTNFTPILTYKSDTATVVPSAGNLTNSANGAELAVNTADKRLFTKDSGGNVVELGTNPSSVTLPNGTANGVVYANGSKVLTTGVGLTFDGADLKLGLAGSFETVFSGEGLVLSKHNVGPKNALISAADNSSVLFLNNSAAGWDSVAMWASGSEQMRLTSTGLGIGTSSPAVKLEVLGADNGGYARMGGGDAPLRSLRFSSFAVSGVNNTGHLIDAPGASGAAGTLAFATNSTERMRLDTSGNLGLGVTPSAWGSSYKAIQLAGGSLASFSNSALDLYSNAYDSGTGAWKYVASLAATRYAQSDGKHIWFNAPIGTAGNAISFTQAMTLTAGGDLLLGGTSGSYKLNVINGKTFAIHSDVDNCYAIANAPMFVATTTASPIIFQTNSTERARIDSSGNLIQTVNTTAATLATNGTLTFSIVDNSTLRISVRGSDGTTRTATVALT